MKKNIKQHQKGNALIITILLFVAIATSISMGLAAPTISAVKSSKDSLESKRSYAIAESGVEDVFYRVRNVKQVSSTEYLTIGDQSTTTSLTDLGGDKKQIVSLGDSNDRNRTIAVTVQKGAGASFVYGMQGGQGGITMANGSQVNGSVYSNGPITGSGTITGSATSANSASLYADQQNGTGTPTNDIVFGDTSGNQDVAQSFQITAPEPINKVQFYIKKVGAPSNLTVKLVTDNTGSPGTTILGSGSLSASSVSTTYGWADVTLSSSAQLNDGVTYWIVLDGSTSSSKYYVIGGNTGYGSGLAKIGQYGSTWSNTSPSGLDIYFKVYLGGLTGLISGISVGSAGVGNVYSHTVNSSTIVGVNYCQTGSGNNKACNTTLPDPVAVDMPISEANILEWKEAASDGGTYTGNYTVNGTTVVYGPKKIIGDLTITNNAVLTLDGTLWVTGNVDISNNGTVNLAAWYGSSSGALIVDGTVTIGNNANFGGSGTSGSYILILSTSTSTSAITLENNSGAVLLYAANGTVSVSNNAGAAGINGYRINLNNNATVTYQTGLANANFVNGPGGTWNSTAWVEQ